MNLASSRRAADRLKGLQSTPTLEKMNSWESPVVAAGDSNSSATDVVTLDAIVTEYLMNQHALCKCPMVTCPQFDLLVPHKCPDGKSKTAAPVNFTARVQRRSLAPPYGGTDGARFDRKLVRPQRDLFGQTRKKIH